MAHVTLNGTSDALLAILAAVSGRTDITISGLELNGPVETGRRAPVTIEPEPEPEPTRTPVRRNGKPRASVRYHVTRRGNGNIDKMAIGAKAKQVLAYLRDQGPHGLAELQAKLGALKRNPIKPKTVDGSVYQLRVNGLIESRDV
jgi:hypothetical protein